MRRGRLRKCCHDVPTYSVLGIVVGQDVETRKWAFFCMDLAAWDDSVDVVRLGSDAREESSSAPGTLAVIASDPIPAGHVIARIPCKALLCARHSALSHHPAFQNVQASLTPVLSLTFCVLYEAELGDASKFASYLALFPDVHLPLAWDPSSDEATWLRGTEASRILRRQEHAWSAGYKYIGTSYSELRHVWHTIGERIMLEALGARVSWAAFLRAYSSVSSRAFVVDLYHGLSMVPFADLLNHGAPNNAQIESDVDAYSAEMGGTVDVRAIDSIDPGEEVLNSYGELGNAELLCQYGFVLDTKSGWERCSWDVRVPEECTQLCACLECDAPSIHHVTEPQQPADAQRASGDDGLPPAYVDAAGGVYDFAPVSHTNRHDRQCPIFIDASGRASWVLWRLALGLCSEHVYGYEAASADTSLLPSHVRAACQRITRLCHARLSTMYIQRCKDALPSTSSSSTLHWAVQHAWQDWHLLRACLERYAT